MCSGGQHVLDDDACIDEHLHRVEERGTAHLELSMQSHEPGKLVDGEDAIGHFHHPQHFVALGGLAHGSLFHVARQSLTGGEEGLLLVVHIQSAKIRKNEE